VRGVHVDGVTSYVIVSVTPSEKLVVTRREERRAANNDCRVVSGTPIAKPKHQRRDYQRNLMRARRAKDKASAAPEVRRTEQQDRAL
jgi:hypothetical protein